MVTKIGTWLLLPLFCLTILGNCAAMSETKTYAIGDRSFNLVSPSSVKGAAPLVLALHGGFGNAEWFARALPLDSLAAQYGFRVAYLEGSGRIKSWNAGRCCGPAARDNVNDVRYIEGVIAELSRAGLVSDVKMVGHSNGAMMTYRYLCEGKTKVSAAVIMSGSMMTNSCRGISGTRVLALHGSQDENVPIAGGIGKGPVDVPYTSLEDSTAAASRAGARVRIEILKGAGHRLRQLDRVARRQDGKDLPHLVFEFLFRG